MHKKLREQYNLVPCDLSVLQTWFRSLKGNTHTLNRGFSQLSMLMGELLQNHSNQSYCSELGN